MALDADDASWVSGCAPTFGAYTAKARYRQADAPCTLAPAANGDFHLDFSEARWAVTPSQSGVLYDGEVCLGFGAIGVQA